MYFTGLTFIASDTVDISLSWKISFSFVLWNRSLLFFSFLPTLPQSSIKLLFLSTQRSFLGLFLSTHFLGYVSNICLNLCLYWWALRFLSPELQIIFSLISATTFPNIVYVQVITLYLFSASPLHPMSRPTRNFGVIWDSFFFHHTHPVRMILYPKYLSNH